MHNLRFGKTNSPTGKSLDSGSESQVFALNSLGFSFPHFMLLCWQIPLIGTPSIRTKSFDTKGFKQPLELKEHFILAPAKHISQYLLSSTVNRMSQPSGISFLAYITPHFI
jgi:hypothetical protein